MPVQWVDHLDLIAAAWQRSNKCDLALRQDGRAELLGQVEIVQVKAVLGPVGTPRQTFATQPAASALRPATIKERIGPSDLRLS